jgi:glucose/arabinose dehydrogenase
VEEPVVVLDGLDFPSSIAFDDAGSVYLAETGLPFGGAEAGGRVLRVDAPHEPGATTSHRIADGLAQPVTGLCRHGGTLYVSEGGAGRIIAIDEHGERTVVIEGMPGPGNYHTNVGAVGPDGYLYFSQGAMANLGVIGLDAYELGWLRRLPHAYDVPGLDVTLTGFDVTTTDPFGSGPDAVTSTGAFVPFGTATKPGQRILGEVRCTAAVLRCRPDGGDLQLVAWGLRNAFGLGFLPDGRLLAVDQGADDRGSRPIGAAPDLLFEVRSQRWYGWPDFVGGNPVTDPRFRPVRGPRPTFVLANHDELPAPEQPLLEFPPHVSATKFAAVPGTSRHAGSLVMALFGDETPMTAPPGHPAVGRYLLLVDPDGGTTRRLEGTPDLRRPIDVAFGPDGALYILDFGRFEMSGTGVQATAGTGRLWRWPGWEQAALSGK